jgi:flavin reductase (DIM6/NTAB) family NADH-FMN oxidoreductase RutF
MATYQQISNNKAYHLLNPGSLILVSSVSGEGVYNIAPIAWQCPVEYDPVTRLLFVCDLEHKTYKNITETKTFIISVPHANQLKLIKDFGGCSGNEIDKFKQLNIHSFKGSKVNSLIPEGVIGFLECKLYNVVIDGAVGLLFGEVVNAMVQEGLYEGRLLTENEECKPIHHLAGKKFYIPGDRVL